MGTASWEPPGQCWGSRPRECAPLSPQNNQENPSHKQLADLHLEKYSFPVEMMICLPNGTVVGPPPPQPRPGTVGRGSSQPGHRLTDLIRLRVWLPHFLAGLLASLRLSGHIYKMGILMPSPPASCSGQDAPLGRGTPTAPRGPGSSRHRVAAAWKGPGPGGKAHLDHCSQRWDGRRRDRPGTPTPPHPRPSQTSRPYLSLRAPSKHPSAPCSWLLTAAGS